MNKERRLHLLDHQIRDKNLPTWIKWGAAASQNGEKVWTSKRTWEKDIADLKSLLFKRYPNVHSPLLFRNGYYYHQDVAGLSDLSNKEIEELSTLGRVLLSHKNLILTDHVRNSLEKLSTFAKVYDYNNLKEERLWDAVEFQEEGRRQGQQHVDDFIEAINSLKPTEFLYQAYNKEKKLVRVLPLLVKEWENAWYLLASPLNDSEKSIELKLDSLKVYALNRIVNKVSVSQTSCRSKIKNIENFKPSEYFKNIYGITNYNLSNDESQKDVRTIVFETRSGWHYGYFLANPIHSSKRIIENIPGESYIKVQVSCQLNPELLSFLMRFLPDITIIQPMALKLLIKKRIEEMSSSCIMDVQDSI